MQDLNFRNSTGSGLVVTVPAETSGTVSVSLSRVTMLGNSLFGLLVNDTASSRATIDLYVVSSSFSGNGRAAGVTDIDAVRVNETGAGGIVAIIRDSRLEDNGGDGVELDESGTGDVELRVRRSRFQGNGDQDPDDLEDGLDIDEGGEGDGLRCRGCRVGDASADTLPRHHPHAAPVTACKPPESFGG